MKIIRYLATPRLSAFDAVWIAPCYAMAANGMIWQAFVWCIIGSLLVSILEVRLGV